MNLAIKKLSVISGLCLVWLVPTTARALSIGAVYDTSITNHPQASTIIATIDAAIARYPSRISDPVTVTITFQRVYTGLAASSSISRRVTYSSYLAALRAHANSSDDAIALGHLPDGPANPVTGTDSVFIKYPLARALGLATGPQQIDFAVLPGEPNDQRTQMTESEVLRRRQLDTQALLAQSVSPQAASDGIVSLNLSSMNLTQSPPPAGKFSLLSAACHEIDEVLASASVLNNLSNGAPAPTGHVQGEDLFRYDKFGNRSLTTSGTDSSYFSLDGVTRLVRFNQTQGGDFSDWWSPSPGAVPARVQDAFGTPGVEPAMNVEWQMLDVLGYSNGPAGVWVDFAWGGAQTGAFATPYSTLAQAISAVPVGGTIFIKGYRSSGERPTITKAMTLATVGGPATIAP